ncbi:MAG: sigma-70 family RNA polymerase sigma factor [Bacilli bacterium]
MKLTNEHIIKFSKGDKISFEIIFDNMFDSLCLYGTRIYNDSEIVKDAVQEVFIELWNKRAQFSEILKTKAYMYVAVKNKILNRIKTTHTISINEINTEDNKFVDENINTFITIEESYKSIYQAIETLPSQTSKILRLTLKEYSNKEIAKNLNISINTVKTLKKNGYSKLRKMLKKNIFLIFI